MCTLRANVCVRVHVCMLLYTSFSVYVLFYIHLPAQTVQTMCKITFSSKRCVNWVSLFCALYNSRLRYLSHDWCFCFCFFCFDFFYFFCFWFVVAVVIIFFSTQFHSIKLQYIVCWLYHLISAFDVVSILFCSIEIYCSMHTCITVIANWVSVSVKWMYWKYFSVCVCVFMILA